MRGIHHVVVETDRLKYEFDIKRNITVIQGDSATGKTTLINLFDSYARLGDRSGIRIQSDVPCLVFSGNPANWQIFLQSCSGSIIFFDEDYSYVVSKEFAAYIRNTDNYYVFVTRRPLRNLPYSIREIYGIRTSGKYHFPEKIYHELYPLYPDDENAGGIKGRLLLVEDEKAGFQFFSKAFGHIRCISASGNANIYRSLLFAPEEENIMIIADGAAFGAYIDEILKIIGERRHTGLYLPESFEWLILKSGIVKDSEIERILAHPEDYIESKIFFSWERFFTKLLEEKTADQKYRQYHKDRIQDYYLSQVNVQRILQVLPDDVQEFLSKNINI